MLTEIREDMLKFFAKTFKNYKKFMNPQTEEIVAEKFKKTKFLKDLQRTLKLVDHERRFFEQFLENSIIFLLCG
eukprot:UN00864